MESSADCRWTKAVICCKTIQNVKEIVPGNKPVIILSEAKHACPAQLAREWSAVGRRSYILPSLAIGRFINRSSNDINVVRSKDPAASESSFAGDGGLCPGEVVRGSVYRNMGGVFASIALTCITLWIRRNRIMLAGGGKPCQQKHTE